MHAALNFDSLHFENLSPSVWLCMIDWVTYDTTFDTSGNDKYKQLITIDIFFSIQLLDLFHRSKGLLHTYIMC